MRSGTRVLFFLLAVIFTAASAACNFREDEPLGFFRSFNDKFNHADSLLFINTVGAGHMESIFGHPLSVFPELIFVHSREEAEAHERFSLEFLPPDDMRANPDQPAGYIIAWPSAATREFLDWLNPQLLEMGFDFDEFSLSHPITVEDTVNNWEQVLRLWSGLPHLPEGSIDGKHWALSSSFAYREELRYFWGRWMPEARHTFPESSAHFLPRETE